MGIKDILEKKGSVYTSHDGATPSTNGLATKSSPLHAIPNGQPGYSLNGDLAPVVRNLYNEYEDGVVNPLPMPSQLDLNGKTPARYTNPETGLTYP